MSAALTTPRARNLRPTAVVAASLVAAAVLGGLVGLAVPRTATSQQAAHPLAVSGIDHTGIPYQGTGLAADTIRRASGSEVAGTTSLVVPETTDHTGIPYQGTGLAADIIRRASGGTVSHTGVPYAGTGTAADLIRASFGGAAGGTAALVPPRTTDDNGIRYPGSGTAAELIRASLNEQDVSLRLTPEQVAALKAAGIQSPSGQYQPSGLR